MGNCFMKSNVVITAASGGSSDWLDVLSQGIFRDAHQANDGNKQ